MTTTTTARQDQLLRAAFGLYDRGLAVVPITRAGVTFTDSKGRQRETTGKGPIVAGWQTRRLDRDELSRRIHKDKNVVGLGVVSGHMSNNLVVLDFDGTGWAGAFEHFMNSWPELANTPVVETGSGKRHVWIHCPDLPGDFTNEAYEQAELAASIELRGNGSNNVAPPSLHPSGGYYRWATDDATLTDTPFEELRQWLAKWGTLVRKTAADREPGQPIMDALIPGGQRNNILFSQAGYLRRSGMEEDEILAALFAINSARCDPPLDAAEVESIAASACRYDPTYQIGGNGHGPGAAHPSDIVDCLYRNEAGDADLFARLNKGKVVYDHHENEWYLWDGHHWKRDVCKHVLNLVSGELAGTYLEEAGRQRKIGEDDRSDDLAKRAGALRYRNRINSVLGLALAHPDLRLEGTEWSTDPWLLGCANGVLNLKTGDFQPGSPEDYIRTYCPTEWQGLDAPAERWEQFLDEIFSQGAGKETDTAELVAFVKRLLGYSLTGLATEHALPIAWGEEGRNGKDTLFTTMLHVLGHELAGPVDIGTLTEKSKDAEAPSPMLYSLRFKRLTWASEPSRGVWLNSAKVKLITGGGAITARGLHKDPVTFDPQYLAFVLCNPRPHAPADDEALWERVLLIPFIQRFIEEPTRENEHQRDQHLGSKLQIEAPGILASLVMGCLDWQTNGLRPPQLVKLATKEYREEEDALGRFLDERTYEPADDDPNRDLLKIKAGQLYAAYKLWCEQNGITPENMTRFGKRMVKRGYEKTDPKATRFVYYLRLTLIEDEADG